MPADNELDPLDRWLNQQVRPLPPPPGTFELITKRARHRRVRKAVISVAGAAAVAAAIGVAVPVSMSLHLNTTSTNAGLAAGSSTGSTGATQSSLGTGSKVASPAASSASASPAAGTPSAGPNVPGWLPPNFIPSSVTWDSLTTGWVLGPAGTPGHCGAKQDSSICTSIAVTHDGGQTWSGLPAPTGGQNTPAGVSGLRFLNATYGWAFGPGLWATDDGGDHWHLVDTGNLSVPQLETINGRAYALFADCRNIDQNPDAACTAYTLKTATAGSDNWTPVGGVPGNLTGGSADFTQAAGQQDAAILELAGATGTQPATGYLVGPDGTLYEGPLDGTAWHKVAALPCVPGQGNGGGGRPEGLQLAPAGTTAAGATRLVIVCRPASPAAQTSVYRSTDNGSTWAAQAGVAALPAATVPSSLTTLPDGTLILAANPSGGGVLSGGIYLLPPGATQWQQAKLSDPSGQKYGFTYVGMTSATQGVALGGNPDLHAIWMTTDGGQTWTVRPIQS
jgi:hypothetical protein